jgi:hypothetical protein
MYVIFYHKNCLDGLAAVWAVWSHFKQVDIRTRHWIRLGDAKGLAVNAPPEFSNELGHELAKESGTFGVSYQFDGTNQRWFFAIRSTGDYDVGAIAKLYGGGGHKNAAGFSVNLETFFRLMEEACILGNS